MSAASSLAEVSSRTLPAMSKMLGLGLALFPFSALLYILQYKDYMLFSSRDRKSGGLKANKSGSRESKDSIIGKKAQKIFTISPAQLRLRQAINAKFQKSKIKHYRYSRVVTGFEKQKLHASNSSLDSTEMDEYKGLARQRFINLKQYHKVPTDRPVPKQYLIKFRKSENKKTINTGESFNSTSKFYVETEDKAESSAIKSKQLIRNINIFESSFKQRKTVSAEKKESEWRKLGFDYHSASKNLQNAKRAPSQQDEPKSRLHYFRKQNKSPQQKLQYL